MSPHCTSSSSPSRMPVRSPHKERIPLRESLPGHIEDGRDLVRRKRVGLRCFVVTVPEIPPQTERWIGGQHLGLDGLRQNRAERPCNPPHRRHLESFRPARRDQRPIVLAGERGDRAGA